MRTRYYPRKTTRVYGAVRAAIRARAARGPFTADDFDISPKQVAVECNTMAALGELVRVQKGTPGRFGFTRPVFALAH